MKSIMWLPIILLTGLLTACGGSGGSDDVAGGSSNDAVATTSIKSGIAVDPYITGAMFEELGADGETKQLSSIESDATGKFAFDSAIMDGAIIQITSTKGLHANAPYTGVIKRQVFDRDVEPVTVSPLTTLLANGMTPAAVISMMNNAGLSGLSESGLYADPMATLTSKTGSVTASDLVLLQANMAVNAFMEATNNFNYGGESPAADSPVNFNDIAAMVRESLNPALYQQMVSDIGADFTVGDMANMAVVVNNTAAQGIRQQVMSGGPVDPMTTMDNAMANATTIADGFYQARTGMGGGTTDPGTGTGGGSTATGSELYTANCQMCHSSLANNNINNQTASGIQNAINNVGSMGSINLPSSDIQLIADALAGSTTTTPPTTDPGTGTGGGTTATGSELYTADCQLCHGSLANSTVVNRTASGIQSAITSVGSMGSINLTSSEVQLIADALAGTTTTPPTTDPGTGTGGGTPACGSCHGLPPTGTTAGSHAEHVALKDIGTIVPDSCNNCHDGSAHQSGFVDLGFPATWNANSGSATDNMDGTCSNIICHGGQKTPVWGVGSIDVNTDCTSCHARGTTQYNSYNSGQHGRSQHVNRACTDCHNTSKLTVSHFENLDTTVMEGPASATVGGGSTRISSYDASTRNCTTSCHGSENWGN